MIRRRRELKKEEFLADVFAVYLKTKNFHWHASVPHFREYHPLFDEQGEQIFAVTDDIAERVRKIGARLAFDRQYWPLATAQGQ
jgi:DNA-binding ferritin-like protein